MQNSNAVGRGRSGSRSAGWFSERLSPLLSDWRKGAQFQSSVTGVEMWCFEDRGQRKKKKKKKKSVSLTLMMLTPFFVNPLSPRLPHHSQQQRKEHDDPSGPRNLPELGVSAHCAMNACSSVIRTCSCVWACWNTRWSCSNWYLLDKTQKGLIEKLSLS